MGLRPAWSKSGRAVETAKRPSGSRALSRFCLQPAYRAGQNLSVGGLKVNDDWRQHDWSLAQKFIRRSAPVARGENDSFSQPLQDERPKQVRGIPTPKPRTTHVDEIDFHPLDAGLIQKSFQESFFGLALVKDCIDQVNAQDTGHFLLEHIRGIL